MGGGGGGKEGKRRGADRLPGDELSTRGALRPVLILYY